MLNKILSHVLKVVRLIFTIALFLALFFLPAGTIKWPEAWVLIIFYIVSILGVIFWLKKNDPGLDAVRFRWSNVPLLLKI
ncbi:MAG: hypothetical protein MUP98_16285, partial [Candidatus Aminicenantes bacterium]|nr:hypothetical protein [Candidatus Aminicenantes bacterium]